MMTGDELNELGLGEVVYVYCLGDPDNGVHRLKMIEQYHRATTLKGWRPDKGTGRACDHCHGFTNYWEARAYMIKHQTEASK